jgi:hypothetical protein
VTFVYEKVVASKSSVSRLQSVSPGCCRKFFFIQITAFKRGNVGNGSYILMGKMGLNFWIGHSGHGSVFYRPI